MDKLDKLDIGELYKQSPPAFGHAMHQYFALDPEYINLNHGTPKCLIFSNHPLSDLIHPRLLRIGSLTSSGRGQ